MTNEDELAWALADIATSRLADLQRHQLYIAIGTREFFPAIKLALSTVTRHDIALPAELVSLLTTWLDRYPDHEDEPTLRRLLGTAKMLPPTPAPQATARKPSYLSLTQGYRRRGP